MRDPRNSPTALALLQTIDMTLYIIAGVVIYWFAGVDVTSPALDSAGPLISRIAYGVALPIVRLPQPFISSERFLLTFKSLDCYRQCYQQPCRRQVNMHPYLRRNRPDAQTRSSCNWFLGWPYCLPLDYRVNYCRGDPRLRQPPYPYCMLQPTFFKSLQMLT